MLLLCRSKCTRYCLFLSVRGTALWLISGLTAQDIRSTLRLFLTQPELSASDNRFNHATPAEFLMQVSILDQVTLRV